ncbi:hypothetical protein VNO78_22810 [Psophocarpus tetragonolobus]|uniref:Uncharacterized protein n=1 Tax=Psophocarpus tetragonolobus TaxID=3891 RepID=A0AAN9S3F8_PSOTE
MHVKSDTRRDRLRHVGARKPEGNINRKALDDAIDIEYLLSEKIGHASFRVPVNFTVKDVIVIKNLSNFAHCCNSLPHTILSPQENEPVRVPLPPNTPRHHLLLTCASGTLFFSHPPS